MIDEPLGRLDDGSSRCHSPIRLLLIEELIRVSRRVLPVVWGEFDVRAGLDLLDQGIARRLPSTMGGEYRVDGKADTFLRSIRGRVDGGAVSFTNDQDIDVMRGRARLSPLTRRPRSEDQQQLDARNGPELL